MVERYIWSVKFEDSLKLAQVEIMLRKFYAIVGEVSTAR